MVKTKDLGISIELARISGVCGGRWSSGRDRSERDYLPGFSELLNYAEAYAKQLAQRGQYRNKRPYQSRKG